MDAFLRTKYEVGTFAVCHCNAQCYLVPHPERLPGCLPSCECGNKFSDLETYWGNKRAELMAKEMAAKVDAWKLELMPSEIPAGVSPSVYHAFKDVVVPAYIELYENRRIWRLNVLGNTPVDAMHIYADLYALFKTAAEKTGSLDKFRKQTNSQGVVGSLAAEIERLTV